MLSLNRCNYTTHDLELGAVVFALKIWWHYIYDTKCTIFIDYKSLQHIFNQKVLNMRQRRWVELLNDHDCEIKYHLGKTNIVADTLSRKEYMYDHLDSQFMITSPLKFMTSFKTLRGRRGRVGCQSGQYHGAVTLGSYYL
ncbi:putative nucleotidyltransferase, Ribonuclease H [Helianthus annuus]|nr:putative nucleotidyltransferase, Ribonuclease H [Helianthus annuus]